MREIKFRAWDKEGNKWASHNQLLDHTKVSASILPPSILGIAHPNWDFQQFTGLKDKNGSDIYEGDIVKATEEDGGAYIKHKKAYQISFDEEQGAFMLGYGGVSFYGMGYFSWFRIIGNVHENPNLLK